MTVREQWFFDGWELTQGTVLDWALRTGTGETSTFMGENTSVPGRSGSMWRPKVQGPLIFTLDVWIKGDTRDDVQGTYDLLLRAARRRNRQVLVKRIKANGEAVVTDAELIGTIVPTYLSQRVWRASLTFSAGSGCWRSEASYTHKSSQSSSIFPKTLELVNYELCTEAMDELTIKVHGPGTNLTITDVTDGVDGDWLKYAAALAADQFFTLNCKTWAWTAGRDSSPNDSSWFNIHAVQFSATRYLPIPAGRPGDVPTVRITVPGANGTTGTYVEVSGPRSYAV